MQIYIHKNNQQHGPFEEGKILEFLRAGQLSPSDMAIRQGETQWQSLGSIFPNVTASAATVNLAVNISTARPVAAVQKKSGSRSALKILLVTFGLLLFLVGMGGVLYSFVLSFNAKFPCDAADDSYTKIEKLRRENKPENLKLIEFELPSAEVSQRDCNERKAQVTLVRVLTIPIALLGLFMFAVALFAGRRKKAV
jgi:hypothetical protein